MLSAGLERRAITVARRFIEARSLNLFMPKRGDGVQP
jgi:hypothetical protein